MYIYRRYYILGDKNRKDYFLTEDKDYTSQLDWAEKFSSQQEANNAIVSYIETESDPEYTGDFFVGDSVEVRMVEVNIK